MTKKSRNARKQTDARVCSLPLFWLTHTHRYAPPLPQHPATHTNTDSNLYSLNPERHDCLWQNSEEVSSCLTLAYHQTLSPSFLTHTHTLCYISVTLSTPRTPRGMRSREREREKKGDSALGEKLIHVSGIDVGASSWQRRLVFSPGAFCGNLFWGSWTLMLHLMNACRNRRDFSATCHSAGARQESHNATHVLRNKEMFDA